MAARVLARRRVAKVAARYEAIGGRSPVPEEVGRLADVMGAELGSRFEVRPAFRHLSPTIPGVLAELAAAGIDRAVALPLFPQRSWTTTDSCLAVLHDAAPALGVALAEVPSFPTAEGLVEAVAAGVNERLTPGAHVLMVAHGLPRRNERRGDPYVGEVRQTAEAVAALLPEGTPWSLAFQSRLGPAAWVQPYLEHELDRLGANGAPPVVIAPVAFGVENLETRWDLDHEAARRAEQLGLASFARAPAPGRHPAFARALVQLVHDAVAGAGWSEVTEE
jgi:ferrochelatase